MGSHRRASSLSSLALAAVVAFGSALTGCGSDPGEKVAASNGAATIPAGAQESDPSETGAADPSQPDGGAGTDPSSADDIGSAPSEPTSPGGADETPPADPPTTGPTATNPPASSGSTEPDPDTPVSTVNPDPHGTVPEPVPTEVPNRRDLVGTNPHTPESVIVDPTDPSRIIVRFWGGVTSCYGAEVTVTETPNVIEVALRTGSLPGMEDRACIAIAELQQVTVALSAPVGNREIRAATS